MFQSTQYQLLDFGDCRRLERFGPIVLDRPCPAAESVQLAAPRLWASAHARFQRVEAERGEWIPRGDPPRNWTITWGPASLPGQSGSDAHSPIAPVGLTFELKQTDFGHIGLFPEQAENWDWIAARTRTNCSGAGNALKVLNLFAYTGGSTLAAAAAGARVTHVDAARNIVAWARHNAELSGLGAAPIRWIAEDSMKFVKREIRRGNHYDAVILDPPSYGHGPQGEVWRLAEDLAPLLELCAELTMGRPQFVVLSCHTPGFTAEHLGDLLAAAFGTPRVELEAGPLELVAPTGYKLPSGITARLQTLQLGPN
jgi:23S rRNA (cytosine1962-C5)-methyltransferase